MRRRLTRGHATAARTPRITACAASNMTAQAPLSLLLHTYTRPSNNCALEEFSETRSTPSSAHVHCLPNESQAHTPGDGRQIGIMQFECNDSKNLAMLLHLEPQLVGSGRYLTISVRKQMLINASSHSDQLVVVLVQTRTPLQSSTNDANPCWYTSC